MQTTQDKKNTPQNELNQDHESNEPKTFLQQPGSVPGAFIGMVLACPAGFYPSIKSGIMLIFYLSGKFPTFNPDIFYCTGLLLSCISQLIFYFAGFTLGALMGYTFYQCYTKTAIKVKEILQNTQLTKKI